MVNLYNFPQIPPGSCPFLHPPEMLFHWSKVQCLFSENISSEIIAKMNELALYKVIFPVEESNFPLRFGLISLNLNFHGLNGRDSPKTCSFSNQSIKILGISRG